MPDTDHLLRGLREVVNAALVNVARRGGNPIGLTRVVERVLHESGYDNTDFGRTTRADMLHHRADVAANAGEFNKAGDMCLEAARLVPTESVALPLWTSSSLRYATLANDADRRRAALAFIAEHLARFDWQGCRQILGNVCDPGITLPEDFRSALTAFAERAGATPQDLAEAEGDRQLIHLVYRLHGETAPPSSSRRPPFPTHGKTDEAENQP